ncbi:DUF805 domain-containing protein [Hymenobacter sp. BT523]|uniref:DUF805 domain-containing protein n=1 Tax=Hymenobacter sp. BT523 TaxID=2795725 RepID=UPI0018EB30BB|nr:DUF805 domain-containing protein [Hymenobacter sp. BT523]MBJ6108930.1 DUF805 domain-containing protein [Hymenobacter sp. BT523]
MAFFTANGRLRRRAYLLRVLGLYTLAILFYAAPGLLYAAEVPPGLALAALAGIVAVLYLTMVQVALRLHDLDLRAWWWLVMLLPGVSYVLGAGLQFVQGTVGPNRFGPDPKRPHLLPALPLHAPESEPASEA